MELLHFRQQEVLCGEGSLKLKVIPGEYLDSYVEFFGTVLRTHLYNSLY